MQNCKTSFRPTTSAVVCVALVVCVSVSAAVAQTAAFSYQGRVIDGGLACQRALRSSVQALRRVGRRRAARPDTHAG